MNTLACIVARVLFFPFLIHFFASGRRRLYIHIHRLLLTTMNTPYLGSTITVVSNRDVRYEGTLSAIDTTNSTVTLQNVRHFGTEGRASNGGPQIPGSSTVYPVIVFNGGDIKNLAVKTAAPTLPQAAPQQAGARPRPAARKYHEGRHSRA